VALHGRGAACEVRPDLLTADGRKMGHPHPRKRGSFSALWPGWQGGGSVTTLGAAFLAPVEVSSRMLPILCWLLDESCPTIGTNLVKRGGTNW
jgi:hypothetical protein